MVLSTSNLRSHTNKHMDKKSLFDFESTIESNKNNSLKELINSTLKLVFFLKKIKKE